MGFGQGTWPVGTCSIGLRQMPARCRPYTHHALMAGSRPARSNPVKVKVGQAWSSRSPSPDPRPETRDPKPKTREVGQGQSRSVKPLLVKPGPAPPGPETRNPRSEKWVKPSQGQSSRLAAGDAGGPQIVLRCPRSAGFQTCRIADFQIGRPSEVQGLTLFNGLRVSPAERDAIQQTWKSAALCTCPVEI